MALLIKIIAEFRKLIGTAIPDIIQLAKESSRERGGAAEALLTLSNDGKTANISVPALLMKIIVDYRPLIQMAIPGIAKLLTETTGVGQMAAAEVLSRLSEQGKTSQYILSTFLITITAEFCSSIGPAVPLIVKLLKDSPQMVYKAVDTLSNLSAHGKRANISDPLY